MSFSSEYQTERLHLCSIKEKDREQYHLLFSNPQAMAKIQHGNPWDKKTIDKVVDISIRRWKEKNPYSGFAVFEKTSGKFVGHVALTAAEDPGVAEAHLVLLPSFWDKKYGTELAAALERYSQDVRKFEAKREWYSLKGKPLCRVIAKAKADNLSNRLIE